jgi:hypothetical protein
VIRQLKLALRGGCSAGALTGVVRQRQSEVRKVTRGLLVAATVLVAVNVWAGDPWQKSYKQWDATDVRRILNDSPWSKTVEIERMEKLGLEAPGGAPKFAGAPGAEEEDEREEKDDDDRGKGEKERKKDQVKFRVRWVSSRTLREASVRGQVLQGRIAEADEDKTLPPAAADYELALVGTHMTIFNGADESTLRDKAYLTAKKSKERITASKVEIVRSVDGKRINAIVFHFPKQNPSGQATVSADEKELKFVSRAGTIEIRVSFDLQKMVDQQGMDL